MLPNGILLVAQRNMEMQNKLSRAWDSRLPRLNKHCTTYLRGYTEDVLKGWMIVNIVIELNNGLLVTLRIGRNTVKLQLHNS